MSVSLGVFLGVFLGMYYGNYLFAIVTSPNKLW